MEEQVEKNYCDIVKVLKFSTIVETIYHEMCVETGYETIFEKYTRATKEMLHRSKTFNRIIVRL